jgi:hypothetical protein
LRFLIKPPPTDRLWLGFHERPAMVLDVVPVVAETAVRFDFVRSGLERLLGEMLATAMVLPHMDDYRLPDLDGPDVRTGMAPAPAPAPPPIVAAPTPIVAAMSAAEAKDEVGSLASAAASAVSDDEEGLEERPVPRHARESSEEHAMDEVGGAGRGTGSLLDRTAHSAAELRRRVGTASSSLAAAVLSKANARLSKSTSLTGSTLLPRPAAPPSPTGPTHARRASAADPLVSLAESDVRDDALTTGTVPIPISGSRPRVAAGTAAASPPSPRHPASLPL